MCTQRAVRAELLHIHRTGEQKMVGNKSGSGCNVSVTINNGSSNTRRVGGGRQQVTITPLPPGLGHLFQPRTPATCTVGCANTCANPAKFNPACFRYYDGHGQVSGRLDKVFSKADYKEKKDIKKFTLRHVDPSDITSSDDLKRLIKRNLRDDITLGDFDVGYMLGTEVIRVRTVEDLRQMLCDIRKASGQNATLWCDGLVDDERLKTSKSGSEKKE